MRFSLRLLVFVLLLPATAFGADDRFSSERVSLAASDVGLSQAGRTLMMVGLKSKEDHPVWVRVRMAGGAGCDTVRRLDPKREVAFECIHDSLQAETDYAVAIAVYEDSALATPAEQHTTSVRFRSKQLKEVEAMRDAIQLPKTYDRISYTAKLGMGAALFGNAWSDGVLTVKADGLEFASKKSTVAVPASQMRAVRMVDPAGKGDPWVVVDYDDGQARIFAVKPNTNRGNVNVGFVRISILHLLRATHP